MKENEEIKEIEIGSIQTCSFKSGRQCCDLLSKVLTIKTELAAEGKIKDINLTVSDNNKRHLSTNSSADTLHGSKRINTNNSNVTELEPIPGPSTQETTSTQATASSQTNSSITIYSSDSEHKNLSVRSNLEEKINSRRS